MLVIMTGLPGTGKSTVASMIREELDGIILSKDLVRAALFPEPLIEYSVEQDDFCFHVMEETAEYLFRKDPRRVMIFDGRTFARQRERDEAVSFAEKAGISWQFVECVCSPETALARIAADLARGDHPAKNRNGDLFRRVRAEFQPVREPKLVIDTDQDLGAIRGLIRDLLTPCRKAETHGANGG